MTEAALAGRLDVIFLGDQPALRSISRDPGWRIVSRLVNYRSAFVVPPDSTIHSVADLRGKIIATAFGATTHRDAVRVLSEAGIEASRDVTLVNVDQAEHASVVGAGAHHGRWGNIDAIATYDPTVVSAVSKKLAKIVYEWPSLG